MMWVDGGALRGEYSMRSFGESPSAVVVSHLSQILEASPHQKYSLSAKACLGILNRAERRGKPLPPQLKDALLRQAAAVPLPCVCDLDVTEAEKAP
jgi:DNA (cytosine-5)-methyltransferase 1